MFCTKCGQKMIDGVRFCSKCGNQVMGAPTSMTSSDKPPLQQQGVSKQQYVSGTPPQYVAVAQAPQYPPPQTTAVTPNPQVATKTHNASLIQDRIAKWSELFIDLVDGKDIKRWQKKAWEEFIPIAKNGYFHPVQGLQVAGVLREDDNITMIVPTFFDSDPDDSMVGKLNKAKFKGSAAEGLLILIEDRLIIVHEVKNFYMLYRSKSGEVSMVHEVKPAVSLLSMTSAGPSYEMMLNDGSRILFRIALEFGRSNAYGIPNMRKFIFECDLEKLLPT